MDIPAKIDFLKTAIASLRITLLLQTVLAVLLFLVGFTVIILSFVSPGLILPATLKTVQMLSGAVVAASGLIPIFFSRPGNFVALRSLLHRYQHQQVGGLSRDAKLDEYFDQYFDKLLRG
jgi:cytochrome c biogenesis protein CcdA